MTSWPDSWSALRHLRELELWGAPLSTLPESFTALASLTRLRVFGAPHLTTLPLVRAHLPLGAGWQGCSTQGARLPCPLRRQQQPWACKTSR